MIFAPDRITDFHAVMKEKYPQVDITNERSTERLVDSGKRNKVAGVEITLQFMPDIRGEHSQVNVGTVSHFFKVFDR